MPELFNSPEKQWLRRRIWLPALRQHRDRTLGDLHYLTLAGPEGHDIDLFCNKSKLIKMEHVRVWESSADAARTLSRKYGPPLKIKQGEAFDLCRAQDERRLFPYDVVNLDFTSGAFNVQHARRLPQKVEVIENIIKNQEECASSFLLFVAFAGGADVDTDLGRLFVHKAAYDVATRLGHTEPLFNLTRNMPRAYPSILAAVLPCIFIRGAGEGNFDGACLSKSVYRPGRSRRTVIVSFVFSMTYDYPALSQSFHHSITRMDGIISERQRESLSVSVIDINRRVRPRLERSTGPAEAE